jgi:hypothetical protein
VEPSSGRCLTTSRGNRVIAENEAFEHIASRTAVELGAHERLDPNPW